MEKLTPRAQSLLRKGREATRPSAADRERVFASLRTRLGAGAVLLDVTARLGNTVPPADAAATLPVAAGRTIWSTVSLALVGLGIAGGASVVALGLWRQPASLAKGLPAQVTVQSAAAPAEAKATEATANVESHAEAQSDSPAPSGRRPPNRLAEEVAILSRAAADLRAGRAAEALKALDEHQRKFPNGALAEERRAAKAEALCSLGRVAEASALLARLGSKSPHAARAQRFCSTRSAKRP